MNVTAANLPNTRSREQLLHLLAEAAEVEHSLMCSYLYAAFSLKEEGLSAEASQSVARWRKAIMGVAIEEMGHLLIVANLTVAVGGRPHFGRPNFPVAPGYFPSQVVARLTGFSMATLEHFIFLERPQGLNGDDRPEFAQEDYVREQATNGLMPTPQEYQTIGELYELIRSTLVELADGLGEQALFIGSQAGQLTPPVVDMDGVTRIGCLADAHAALDVVVEQGEGSSADRDGSHYRKFLMIREEYKAFLDVDSGFCAAWPVANNPVLRRPVQPGEEVFIDHPHAASLLDFACAAYGLLLRMLVQSFGRQDDSLAAQQALIAAAFEIMHVVGKAGRRLAELPASGEQSAPNAGMSFTMLRGIEPLLGGDVEEFLLREELQSLAKQATQFEIFEEKSGPKLCSLAASFRLRPLTG